MSRWIRPFAAFSMVLTVLLWQVPPARAQTTGTQHSRARIFRDHLAGLQGRIVYLVRHDGTWLQVRILRVYSLQMVVELADGTQGTIPLASLSAVRDRQPHEPPPSSPSPASSTADGVKKIRPPHEFRVEWIGLRFGIGGKGGLLEEYRYVGLAGFAELTLFTLHWQHFYWEILRAGGGMPHYGYWGTAIGYPIHLDDRERHELRIGVHISFWLGTLPTLSGLQIYYMHRTSKRFAIQLPVLHRRHARYLHVADQGSPGRCGLLNQRRDGLELGGAGPAHQVKQRRLGACARGTGLRHETEADGLVLYRAGDNRVLHHVGRESTTRQIPGGLEDTHVGLHTRD